jgi:hypothetical protein
MIIEEKYRNIKMQTMKILPVYFALLALGLASCGGLKFVQDHDSTINFNRYETYNFTPAADSIPFNQMTKKRLFNAISDEMNGNDIRWAADPDIYVHVHMMMKGKTKTNVSYGQGKTYDLGSGFSTTYMDYGEFSEGSLFFDIIDSKRKQLVWSGKVTSDIKDSNTRSEKDINKIVQKVFKKFPPR